MPIAMLTTILKEIETFSSKWAVQFTLSNYNYKVDVKTENFNN